MVTQKTRWDNIGTQPPANQAQYAAGQQPISEYDNWFNKAVVDDVDALNTEKEAKANKNTANGYAALDAARGIPHHINKVASNNVRNSNDGPLAVGNSIYPQFYYCKYITLTNGLLGQQRFLFDLKSGQSGYPVYGQIYRNSTPIGTLQTTINSAWTTFSEDITQDWNPGDTYGLYVSHSTSAQLVYLQNFRIAYDDAPIVAVASVNNS